jgi:hypothetical protein
MLGQDLHILEVKRMMVLGVVGRFMGNCVKGETLECWLKENWYPLLGYNPLHLMMHGWICFLTKVEEDVAKVLGKKWGYVLNLGI